MYHSVDICYDIAQKLKSPEKVSLMMKEQILNGSFTNEWPEFSFGWGLPGIICFYGMMDSNFENEGWDDVAHCYIKYLKEHLVEDLDISLFHGLAGVSLAVYICSSNGKKYAKMLSKLDELLTRGVRERFLNRQMVHSNPQLSVSPYYYNLADGLSGIIGYLLLRDDLRALNQQCVHNLVTVLSVQRTIDSLEVVPWLVTPRTLGYCDMGFTYSDGFYSLKVNHGITGVLGVLSRAALKGINVDGLHELIQTLAQWIRSKQKIKNGLIYWNPLSPREEPLGIEENPVSPGYDWKMGTLGIAKCLHLASKALRDQELEEYSEGIFLSNLQSFSDWPKSIDTSFFMGKAGLLSIVYHMGKQKKKPVYFEIAKELEEDLKKDYNPSLPFGFQTINFETENKREWSDSPGLLQGVAGIGLSLLEAQGRLDMPWSQVLLTL